MENEKIVETVIEIKTTVARHEKDIEELKDTQKLMYEMNSNIKSIVDKIGNTNEEICEFKSDVKKDIGELRINMEEVKNKSDKKDAEKWDKFKWIAFGAVVMAIFGVIFKQIGLI